MSAIQLPHHITPPAMEVIGLRTMPGQACSHVVGVLHKTSFCSCNMQSITGQSMMFWFDQVVLVGVIGLVSVVDCWHPSKQKAEHGLNDIYDTRL